MTDFDDRNGAPGIADLISWLWGIRLYIIAGGGGLATAGLIYALLATPLYKATVTLLPRSEDASSGLMTQIELISGINLDGTGGNEELYGKILSSTTLLDSLLARKWAHSGHGNAVDLYTVFDIDPSLKNPRNKLHQILRKKVIRFSRDRQTGYMEVSVTVPSDPQFAADLVNAAVEDLDSFNKRTQRVRAHEHRVFVESREADAQGKLIHSEDVLAAFVNENRSYSDSPMLIVEYNRLSRVVSAQSGLWMELRHQVELARIDEHKNFRSVTVLSPADPPVRPISPRLIFDVIVGFFLGCVAVVLFMAIRGERRPVRQ